MYYVMHLDKDGTINAFCVVCIAASNGCPNWTAEVALKHPQEVKELANPFCPDINVKFL